MNNDYGQKFEVRDLRDKNWFTMDNQFLNGYAKFLGVHAVGVYTSLCRHAGINQKAYPSQELIAEELGIGKTTVVDSIKSLEFWGIIKKIRLGLSCCNRYLLLKKSTWRPINEQTLKEFAEVRHMDFRVLLDKLQKSATRSSKVSKPSIKNIKNRKISISSKELIENYKNGDRRYKPYYQGQEIRWSKTERMLKVIPKDNGEWLEFAGKDSDIEWR